MARPSDYTPELGMDIAERLANGESLRSICKTEGLPAKGTLIRWALDPAHPFCVQYARARQIQAEGFADDIIDISDEASDRDSAAASKVRVDARKWVACKMLPKVYGDQVKATDDAPKKTWTLNYPAPKKKGAE